MNKLNMGKVEQLFRKPARGEPMEASVELRLTAGVGISGDSNAIPYSPRQVLLTAAGTLEAFGLEPGVLRENVVMRGIDVDGLPSGSVLQIGDCARVRLTFTCEPCKRISYLFKEPVSVIEGRRGMLAAVVANGKIREGDRVTVTDEFYPPVPERKFERFLWLLDRIPHGKVVTFSQIGVLLGVPAQYLRVIPKFMKRAAIMNFPAHRVVNSESCTVEHIYDQPRLLTEEGVAVHGNAIDFCYHWISTGRPYLEQSS